MDLPNIVKIGGFQWEIVESKDIANESFVFGSTHIHSQKIFIEPGLSEQKRDQTILHEVMHALWWQMGLDRMFEDKKIEEKVVHAISMGLYQVLKDNQQIHF